VTTPEHLTVPVVDMSRTPKGSVDVPASLLQAPVNQHLLHEAVKAQQASHRQGNAATKTRGEVRGGGKKPWRQKGTGRARAGSIRSPIWAGGGTTFGPRPRSYAYRLPRSARRAALCAALSVRFGEARVVVVEDFALVAPKTREMVGALRGLGVEGSTLVVIETPSAEVLRAARNLPGVKVIEAVGLNVYDVLRHESLVVTSGALDALAKRVLGGTDEGA
jgi:large subunit ribosomal protein L4